MLDRLLEQSESYRRKAALVLTFIIGIAIFSVWLVIAGYNVKKFSGVQTDNNENPRTVQQFKQNLPSIRQEDTVITELEKQNTAASAKNAVSGEKESSFDKSQDNE
ncbi:MAG: hypothetical protein U9M90_03875 [Patescibacteria group bacterium]|nr:hypothetical protein [Patescibacteria group bacterium]